MSTRIAEDGATGPRSWLARFASEVRRLGGIGRFAVIALIVAAALTVAMGFAIANTARTHLLHARADLIESEVLALPGAGAIGAGGTEFFAAIDRQIHGGEIRRVKVWTADGTIVHSDDASLVGRSFPLLAPALTAFAGSTSAEVSDLSDPAHAGERDLGELIEIYVPVEDQAGEVAVVVEVEQDLASLNAALVDIRRNVWLSISFGVGALAVFIVAVAIALTSAAERRRRQAEVLLGAAFRAQDEERQRIVGSLHDDVGQPLYRLLYGLEGCRAKVDAQDPVAPELEDLSMLVRSIDTTLRSELERLHHGSPADVGLVAAIEDLARTTERETGLHVTSDIIEEPPGMTNVERTAIFRAIQEAVVNVRKHADATSLSITVRSSDTRIQATVADNGSGGVIERGLGLTTTGERLDALGGGLDIDSRYQSGTRLTAWIPRGGVA